MISRDSNTAIVLAAWLACLTLACWIGSARADDEDPRLPQAAGRSGLGFYKPGMWGIVGLPMANKSDKPIEVTVANSISNDTEMQFCSKVWLPPRSTRRIWQAVRIPDVLPIKQGADPQKPRTDTEIETILYRSTSAGDRQLGRHESLLRIEDQSPTSGMVADVMDDYSARAVVSARLSANWTQRLNLVNHQEMPYFPQALEMMDTLTIAAADPDFDAAQINAIRSWLASGGRVWVMLNSTAPDFCAKLFRESWDVQLVDKVSLSRVTIAGPSPSAPRTFDEPIQFARVHPGSMRVIHTVNGWPASMTMPFGRGEVLVTTLAPEGWMGVKDRALPPLESLAVSFIKPKDRPVLEAQSLRPYLASQIGYRIVSRESVMVVMGVALMAIVGAGVFFRLRQRGEWTALTSLAIALSAGLILVALGAMKRNAVPLMVADGQLVEVIPGQATAIVRGASSIYSPSADDANLASSRGGVAVPEAVFTQGKLTRMVWTDFDAWKFEGLKLPSGDVRSVGYSDTVELPSRLAVSATFDETGLKGTVTGGGLSSFEQALIVTSHGHAVTAIDSAKHFDVGVVKPGDMSLTREAMTSPKLLKRRDILGKYAATPRDPSSPALVVWGSRQPVGPGFGAEASRSDSALYELPIDITKPASGATVYVPWMFMSFKEVRLTKDGLQPVLVSPPLYRAQDRQWVGNVGGSGGVYGMRFLPPASLLPMKPTSVKLTVDIVAPGRTVTVAMFDGTGYRDLRSLDSPSSATTIELVDSRVVEINEQEGLVIAFKVSEAAARSEEETMASIWTVKGVWMEVTGTVK